METRNRMLFSVQMSCIDVLGSFWETERFMVSYGNNAFAISILIGAHIKWEPSEDILVRGAIWTSFTRPSFKQARAYAIFDSDIELCPPGTDDCDDSQGGAS